MRVHEGNTRLSLQITGMTYVRLQLVEHRLVTALPNKRLKLPGAHK